MALKPYQKTNKKRNEKILAYSKQGLSSYQIAGIFHLTGQRVQQILKKLSPDSPQGAIDK